MPQRHPVTTVSAIAAGSAKAFTIAGQRIALFNIDGKFHAIDDTCPHAGAPLADGRINGCLVTCPWHAIRFDVTTGCMPGQAEKSVATFPVFITGDQVEVEV